MPADSNPRLGQQRLDQHSSGRGYRLVRVQGKLVPNGLVIALRVPTSGRRPGVWGPTGARSAASTTGRAAPNATWGQASLEAHARLRRQPSAMEGAAEPVAMLWKLTPG